jgi:CheY-like chemotaxis protein
VIDDDAAFLAQLTQVLKDAGYNVLAGTDLANGMAVLERLHADIDLTVVDLVLPGGSGFELINAASRRPNPMKILATTGLLKPNYLEVAKYMGAHGDQKAGGGDSVSGERMAAASWSTVGRSMRAWVARGGRLASGLPSSRHSPRHSRLLSTQRLLVYSEPHQHVRSYPHHRSRGPGSDLPLASKAPPTFDIPRRCNPEISS